MIDYICAVSGPKFALALCSAGKAVNLLSGKLGQFSMLAAVIANTTQHFALSGVVE